MSEAPHPAVHVTIGDVSVEGGDVPHDELIEMVIGELRRTGGRVATDPRVLRRVAEAVVARMGGRT